MKKLSEPNLKKLKLNLKGSVPLLKNKREKDQEEAVIVASLEKIIKIKLKDQKMTAEHWGNSVIANLM